MRRMMFVSLAGVLVFSGVCYASNLTIKPTTTLAAQTANNSSAANTFRSQSNGNLGAGNVSKEDIHTLLYSGSETKIFAHLMLWFGGSNHMNVGYSSTDPAQVKRQVQDMISRGIDGVIIDWYGPGNSIDQATRLLMAEAEAHPGFTFAIMIDQGAIQWDSCSGCTPQQALVAQLQYLEQTYFPSSAYMRLKGQPVVTNFDIDLAYSIDWNALRSGLATQPLFLFQNNSGFTHAASGGSFSWVMPTTSDFGMSYLTSFYKTGQSFPSEETVGATYKGFNDTLSGWGSNRIMAQQCGQTWLQTFARLNSLYSAGKQLPMLQLVTWNDYEEGSEIETGIDGCFSVSASVSGNALQWTPNGSESTIDRYRVYVSQDGQNLMPLADFTAGLHSSNLCSYPLASGNYTLYVQAVGRPGLKNQLSGPARYTPHCGSGSSSGSGSASGGVSLNASPTSLTLSAGQSGKMQINVSPTGAFNDPIALSCSGLPAGMLCSFSPASVTPGSKAVNSTLTISTSTATSQERAPMERRHAPLPATYLYSFGLGLSLVCGSQRKQLLRFLVTGLLLAGVTLLISCGGGGRSSSQLLSTEGIAPGAYTIGVDGTAGQFQVSTMTTITIR
jgi:hypothetical protein